MYRHAYGEALIDGVSFGVVSNLRFVGDFDGNGADEFLWRHVNGTVELNGNNLCNLAVL